MYPLLCETTPPQHLNDRADFLNELERAICEYDPENDGRVTVDGETMSGPRLKDTPVRF